MRVALSLVLSALVVLILPGAALADGTPILVQLEPGVSASERADVRDDAGVQRLRATELPRTELVDATDTSTATALRRLNRDPDVAWAAPNVTFTAAAVPNDPGFSDQWALRSTPGPDVEAVTAWDVTQGSGEKVAVVDSGVDLGHPDLAGALLAGHDYVNDDSVPEDQQYHGTHVTGILAARSNNGFGIAGIAPQASVIPLKVLGADGKGTLDDILAAFDDAGAADVPIVSASLSSAHTTVGSSTAAALGQAFNAVMSAYPGTLYVVAAGNEHANEDALPSYPCAATVSNLICVGATGRADQPSCYSNVGRHSVDVFAPGDEILSTIPVSLGSYGDLDGTSMATPLVSGIAALARAHDGTLNGAGLAEKLRMSVDPVPGMDAFSGTGGRIDAVRAVGGISAEGAGSGGPWAICPGDDADRDGVPVDIDACPTVAGPGTVNGCPVDSDGDGLPNNRDACPSVPAHTANGCPAVVKPPPAPPRIVIADRDQDGKPDSLDACPTETASTVNGCPVPKLRSLKLTKRKHHKVKVRVLTDRVATVTFKLERQVCNKKGKKCRWRTAASDAAVTSRGAATFSSRSLRKGRYRLGVRVSSSAGKSKLTRKSFRI